MLYSLYCIVAPEDHLPASVIIGRNVPGHTLTWSVNIKPDTKSALEALAPLASTAVVNTGHTTDQTISGNTGSTDNKQTGTSCID